MLKLKLSQKNLIKPKMLKKNQIFKIILEKIKQTNNSNQRSKINLEVCANLF